MAGASAVPGAAGQHMKGRSAMAIDTDRIDEAVLVLLYQRH